MKYVTSPTRYKIKMKRNPYFIHKSGDDNTSNVISQISLKLQTSLAIEQDILHEPRLIIPRSIIGRISAHGPKLFDENKLSKWALSLPS